jgi:hypothetical protein
MIKEVLKEEEVKEKELEQTKLKEEKLKEEIKKEETKEKETKEEKNFILNHILEHWKDLKNDQKDLFPINLINVLDREVASKINFKFRN